MLHAVVMAGGSGTRFWPQSRHAVPKQLLPLAGPTTMIQDTVDRCQGWIAADHTWVVTNETQAEAISQQLEAVPASQILMEPCGRNTAPCLGLAAIHLLHQDPDAVMFVMPADHVIREQEAFREAGRNAVALIESGQTDFVLFGIPPTFPATGYGYIQRGQALSKTSGASDNSEPSANAWEVASFREKPQREVAEEYLRDGGYFWNCGIFCWKASRLMDALEEHEPELHRQLMKLAAHLDEPDFANHLQTSFPEMKSISIDYAVLERATSVSVIEAPFDWDDVGSWLSLPRLLGQDDSGNTVDGRHCGVRTSNCIIRSSGSHLIGTLGTDNLIIVHTDDATLVANRADADAIRQLVDAMREAGLEAYL